MLPIRKNSLRKVAPEKDALTTISNYKKLCSLGDEFKIENKTHFASDNFRIGICVEYQYP